MQVADRLIRTKMSLPITRTNLVPRPRLQERIAGGLRGPLTLITAPAGFGKTTLVASYVTACGLPVAWLSLDKNDNQAGRFLSYLIAALQGVDPRIGGEAAQLMAGIQPAQPEAVLTSLVNDLAAANEEMILVLDDYQFISSPAVHEQVAFLLEHCPPTFHLLIASRSDPQLPTARLRGRSQIVELRAADLRFDGPEVAQFLNEVMNLRLDADAVAVLAERTEGWIAGLQMAALSLRNRDDVTGFIQSFSGTHRYILDYLLEEVLASQSPQLQHFLLYTSILDRLTAPLCDAILEDDKSEGWKVDSLSLNSQLSNMPTCQHILEYLERANLFLVSLDDERVWYRYHHLFADLLRARLHQAHPELLPSLHHRAAAWLEQKGFIPEAIQHLFAAHEYEQAADLIERYGPARLAAGDPSVSLLAEGLPEEMLYSRPIIGLYQAWLRIIQGRITKALPLLNGLAQRLAAVDADPKQRWMGTIVASALAFLAPAGAAQETYPLPDYQSFDEIPAGEPILRNAADILYGMAVARRGDLDRAVEVSIRCIQREKSSQGALAIPTLAPFLTRIYLMQGRLRATASLCHEFLAPVQEKGIRFTYTAGSMKIDLGEVLTEWNYLDEAEAFIRDGLRDNQPWRNIMTDAFGLVALARLLLAKEDFEEARLAVEKLETRLLEQQPRPREFEEDFRTLRVRLQLASGDLDNPARWADQIPLSEDFDSHQELYRLTLTRLRFAQGRYAEVETLLKGWKPPPGAGSRVTRELEANLLRAAAIAREGRLSEALGIVDTSLSLAEPEGYLRIFLDVGGAARELLAAYLRSVAPGHRDYAQKIMDAFRRTSQARPQTTEPRRLVEALTGRELEVLQLMAQGKTNQEIARQLIVSPGTVKAHTASIYRKLDVANRTEATARARKLGLLS